MIGEALAFCRPDGSDATLLIGPAQRLTVVVAEIEFSNVSVQVLFAAMLINAAHSTLED